MDHSERLAEAYLKRCGFNSIRYEPDGNVPPDFLADGRVAVEVRRLNQSFTSAEGHTRDLESYSIPLWQRMKTFLPTVGATPSGSTWFVSMRYQRPGPKWASIKGKIRSELEAYLQSPREGISEIEITPNFWIDVGKASRWHGSNFILGGANDYDAGGFILAETLKNLQRCSEEKEAKIAAYGNKYPEWWLVLPDHIGLGVATEDESDYRIALVFPHRWTRIVLLDPRGSPRDFELPGAKVS